MKIKTISPFEQPKMVRDIACIYQQSFGDDPWNEGYLCPVCGKVFASRPIIKICPRCREKSKKILLVRRWPMNNIISDFYREMSRPDSLCIVAQLPDYGVVGFAWGYKVSADPELDNHLDAPDLHKSLHGNFFYLDECAVAPPYQGQGIGKRLVRHILSQQKHAWIILRTMNDSRMHGIIKNMGGEIIQHISESRVIMKIARP